MDPKTATKLDEVDRLLMVNQTQEEMILRLKSELFRRGLIDKYGADFAGVNADGSIVRTPKETE